MLTLSTDITKINRVGAATAKRLKKLGIATAEDLLFYFPFRYDDFSRLTPIDKVRAGQAVNIVGNIELIQNKRSPRKRMYITEALVSDESGNIKTIWFNQPFIARNLRAGDKVSLAGKVEEGYGGEVLMSPAYEKIPRAQFSKEGERGINYRAVHTQGLIPNYRLTSQLTQKQIRFLIKEIVALVGKVDDWLPEEIIRSLGLLKLGEALKKAHFPKNWDDVNRARRRLAFNELFLIQLRSRLIRAEASRCVSHGVPFREKETREFVSALPFKLTNAQRRAAWEILRDIARDKPMSRLLEGDVGSGKTVVACIAMLNVALNGGQAFQRGSGQAVLMAPTEILASQHYNNICKLLANFNIKIGLITKSEKKINQELNKKIRSLNSKFIIQNSNIIIGTHALIQENVEFKNLVLVIIDEQHRFGVKQRAKLAMRTGADLTLTNAYSPHLLSMTATPIPRSLALALYGDLDISIINQMPAGRKKIITKVVAEEKRQAAYEFIRKEIEGGRQVFVICPLIDFSDKLGVKSVKDEYKKLDKDIFPDLNIGILHGRMKPKEKERIMREFLDGKIKILVSTSVVEVGVDVPNATIMMIEGADRFGLAQLHQFRGRVGRGEHQSYCFLFTDNQSEKTLKRLNTLVDCFDGFALAKADLKFRGPGEIYGTAQKGFPELKVASLFDYELMKLAKEEAEKLVDRDDSLDSWPELKSKVAELGGSPHLE